MSFFKVIHIFELISIDLSWTTKLFCLIQYVVEVLGIDGQLVIVDTNFYKVFDHLNYNILIKELMFFGFVNDLIEFFKSYQQSIKFSQTHAKSIPPRSVLAHWFLLYLSIVSFDNNLVNFNS